MHSDSYWLNSASLPRFPKLEQNLRVDVVVIGGGIAGVTAAYLLKRAGHTVALVERNQCVHGDTGHTTAHLTYVTDRRFHELAKAFSADSAQAAWDAGRAAINQIYQTVEKEEIDCQFSWVPGYLHAPLTGATTANEVDLLRRDAQLATENSMDADFVNEVPLFRRPGVRFANQAQFHPARYLAGLLAQIPGQGCYVFEESPVEEFDSDLLRVKANGYTIDCGYVVLATHMPLVGKASFVSTTVLQTKLAPYSTYVIGAKIPRDSCPHALFWDTSDPYYYLRVERHDDHDYAIFGGKDHKTGQVTDNVPRYEELEHLLKSFLPEATVDHRWSGQVVETSDGLPFIGEIDDKQFIATGFAGNGMTFGTLSGMMACDALESRRNPWSELFDVGRSILRRGAWDYVRENLDYPYYMIKDRITSSEGQGLEALEPGEGKILRVEGQRVAAYRDQAGKVTQCSSVCPHMGCIVHWNKAESTWDCPCHGSRFEPTGEVIAGPADKPLAPVDTSAQEQQRRRA